MSNGLQVERVVGIGRAATTSQPVSFIFGSCTCRRGHHFNIVRTNKQQSSFNSIDIQAQYIQ